MALHNVTLFKPYPFEIGEKIRIESGPRGGDWEVIGLTERTVSLRCPVTRKEVKWDRFCYLAERQEKIPWPKAD